MRRFNAYELYTCGAQLRDIQLLQEGATRQDYLVPLYLGQHYVQQLLDGHPLPIKVTRQTALALQNVLNKLVQESGPDSPERRLQSLEISGIQFLLTQFNTILNAELSNLDTYWVEPKGIYSTNDLIEHAENTFSEGVRQELVDETKLDVNEAGKCLAFDLPTAAAFHVWRAVERELRVYYQSWLGQSPGNKTWNTLTKELSGTRAEPKVLAVLDHLRSLHRNPTMHPEDYLTVDEAVTLFGIANSAITAMVNDKPAPQSDSSNTDS